MERLMSVGSDQLAHAPIRVLCNYATTLPFHEKYNLNKIRRAVRVARFTAREICRMDIRSDLLFGPLIDGKFLPQNFVVYKVGKDQNMDPLRAEGMFELMSKIGAANEEALAETIKMGRIGNNDLQALLQKGTTDNPFHSRDCYFYRIDNPVKGRNLILLSRGTKLTGADFQVGMRVDQEESQDLRLQFVQINVCHATYNADYSL